jgi:hypothetical protein
MHHAIVLRLLEFLNAFTHFSPAVSAKLTQLTQLDSQPGRTPASDLQGLSCDFRFCLQVLLISIPPPDVPRTGLGGGVWIEMLISYPTDHICGRCKSHWFFDDIMYYICVFDYAACPAG